MDSLPSTSKTNKRKTTNDHTNKNQSTETYRPLTISEIEKKAISYMEGDSDGSIDYFNDSGSEWDGDSEESSHRLGEKVVMELCDKYLDAGRTVVTENYYTGVPLAIRLLDRGTHFLGTLRRNRQGLPVEITMAKLKKEEIVGKESEAGFVVGKWMVKREVCFLSIKHGIEMKSTALAVFELLLNTSVVNAWIIWKNLSKKTMQITEFREQLILGLVGILAVSNIQGIPKNINW
ncbi:piggybac transposable element-derived protein 4 [Holotrichia oblita]|uniref:Piggybac transposable element-derived protein 4 n=1 Tax=Holotrichia oblita TaxID=644536 RepID=A0ACB9SNA5_HOLOL|nr:piggybac transposable element-derived protein 4 [Holotrichia oblita]